MDFNRFQPNFIINTLVKNNLPSINKRSMDLGSLLDTCSCCDKLQFSCLILMYGLTLLYYLHFDLSRSLKVKCDSVFGLPIYAFPLIFNSNIWLNSTPLQNIRLQNLSDFKFDLSRSLKDICDDAIGLSIYSFLLLPLNSTYILSY